MSDSLDDVGVGNRAGRGNRRRSDAASTIPYVSAIDQFKVNGGLWGVQ